MTDEQFMACVLDAERKHLERVAGSQFTALPKEQIEDLVSAHRQHVAGVLPDDIAELVSKVRVQAPPTPCAECEQLGIAADHSPMFCPIWCTGQHLAYASTAGHWQYYLDKFRKDEGVEFPAGRLPKQKFEE